MAPEIQENNQIAVPVSFHLIDLNYTDRIRITRKCKLVSNFWFGDSGGVCRVSLNATMSTPLYEPVRVNQSP